MAEKIMSIEQIQSSTAVYTAEVIILCL